MTTLYFFIQKCPTVSETQGGNQTDVYRWLHDARMHSNIDGSWEAWTKSISFSILTIRHRLYIFTTHSPVSSLIKKHHSSHLARIQLRDMALKAQPEASPHPT